MGVAICSSLCVRDDWYRRSPFNPYRPGKSGGGSTRKALTAAMRALVDYGGPNVVIPSLQPLRPPVALVSLAFCGKPPHLLRGTSAIDLDIGMMRPLQ